MAKKRLVLGDQSSAEIDQIRYTLNNLLKVLETAAASITAGASAEDVLNALSAGIAAGADTNPNAVANVVSTGLELVGVQPMNAHPARAGFKPGTQLKDY